MNSSTDPSMNSSTNPFQYSSMQTPPSTCTPDTNSIFIQLKGKPIDWSKVTQVNNISLVAQDGWYKLTITGYINLYVAVYIDKTTDPNYNYMITIVNIDHYINICDNISIVKTNKDGTPAPDTAIPQNVMTNAISTLPTASCGTGIWDGCTAGIQNKYLIVGGGAAAIYLLFLRGKK